MEFIKCKNDAEKLQAIANYCKAKIEENDYQIKYLEAEKSSPLDYADEIAEYKAFNKHFKNIMKIIEADEFTSVLIG